SDELRMEYNVLSDPPVSIGAIFISSTLNRGKCRCVCRRRSSVLMIQMSMLRWGPLTVFWARTIQPISSLLEAICAPGHKIVSSNKTPAPTRQSFPITEQPRICTVGSTAAVRWIGAHQSDAFTCAGRQPSFEITRCTSKYSAREPRLNHLPCSRTTPPIFPPWAIQSPRIGMNDIFCFDGIRAKTDGLHTAMLAKSYSPGTP